MIPKAFNAPNLAEKLQDAVEAYDLPSHADFEVLDSLSAATQFDSIDVHTTAVVTVGNQKFAPATVYVTLRYGLNDPEGEVSWTDSYPARVRFVLENDSVRIEGIDVDGVICF